MKNTFLILLLSWATIYNLNSQTKNSFVLPSPVIGWDSLSNILIYPDLARRTGTQGAYYAKLFIDTLGNVQRIRVFKISDIYEKYDSSIITHVIYQALENTKWYPATNNGQKTFCPITIPFVFIINQDNQVEPILKIVARPNIEVYRHGTIKK